MKIGKEVLKPKDIKNWIEERYILVPRGISYTEALKIINKAFRYQL